MDEYIPSSGNVNDAFSGNFLSLLYLNGDRRDGLWSIEFLTLLIIER